MTGPFQPLPPPVVGMALAAAGVELVFQLGVAGMVGGPEALGWRLEAVRAFGFFEPLWERMLVARRVEAGVLARFATYPFVHLGLLHAVFAVALLLALGQAVARRVRPAGLAAVMAAGVVAGALAFALAAPGRAPLVGLFPAVYGLIGAFTQGLLVEATDRRGRIAAFRLVGVLAAMQLLFRVGLGAGGPEWAAEIGGFLAGFGLGFLVGPGGADRLRRGRDWLRGG